MKAKTRVALYAHNTEGQIGALRDVATHEGWHVAHTYVEDAKAMRTRGRSPQLSALLAAIGKREHDLLAAWSIELFGRSLPEIVTVLTDLTAAECDLYLHAQGLDTRTADGAAIFRALKVFEGFVKSQKGKARRKIRAGLAKARAEGTQLGRPAMDAAKVREIKRRAAKSESLRTIGAAVGVAASTVKRILDEE